MDYVRKYLTTQQGDQAPNSAETIERLCERISSSMLLEDRRDALRAVKSLSKKFRVEVGSIALDMLVHVLHEPKVDADVLAYALDSLCNVLHPVSDDNDGPPSEETQLFSDKDIENMCSQFSCRFIADEANIDVLLSLVEDVDFIVRWPTIRLLTYLLQHKRRAIQDFILTRPAAISNLMDVLLENREVIRNDALLLLLQLTKNNTNIQKIVAFENAFEILVNIIYNEGLSDGGIVVEDCLNVLLSLLRGNSSNQTYFKEGTFLPRLAGFLDRCHVTEQDGGGWSKQKTVNISLMFQLVRSLVSPSNPGQQTFECQMAMQRCCILDHMLCAIMTSGVPDEVLVSAIQAVAELIRGCRDNQNQFAALMAPSKPPKSGIVVLLLSMVNKRQSLQLRSAVLYCFESFLYRNEEGQSEIIQTLLPTSTEVSNMSAGQLLCGGLFSVDPLSNWLAAVSLMHSIHDNPAQKEQLLRVQLASSLGNPPVLLLQQCVNILQLQGSKMMPRIGILMLLSSWLSSCPLAVGHFLRSDNNVPFLVSLVISGDADMAVQGIAAFVLGLCVLYNDDKDKQNNRNCLRRIIDERVGGQTFAEKLSRFSGHESYTAAVKTPAVQTLNTVDALGDSVLLDHQFVLLFKRLENDVIKCSALKQEKSNLDDEEQSSGLIGQYKELIRSQDVNISELKSEIQDLKLKMVAQSNIFNGSNTARKQNSSNISNEVDSDLVDLMTKHSSISPQNQHQNPCDSASKNCLEAQLAAREVQLTAEVESLKAALTSSYEERRHLAAERDNGAKHLDQMKLEIHNQSKQIEQYKKQIYANQIEISQLQAINDTVEQEQKNLLLLLTEMETNNFNFKLRLRELGEEIPSETESDSSDNEEEADEEEEADGGAADGAAADGGGAVAEVADGGAVAEAEKDGGESQQEVHSVQKCNTDSNEIDYSVGVDEGAACNDQLRGHHQGQTGEVAFTPGEQLSPVDYTQHSQRLTASPTQDVASGNIHRSQEVGEPASNHVIGQREPTSAGYLDDDLHGGQGVDHFQCTNDASAALANQEQQKQENLQQQASQPEVDLSVPQPQQVTSAQHPASDYFNPLNSSHPAGVSASGLRSSPELTSEPSQNQQPTMYDVASIGEQMSALTSSTPNQPAQGVHSSSEGSASYQQQQQQQHHQQSAFYQPNHYQSTAQQHTAPQSTTYLPTAQQPNHYQPTAQQHTAPQFTTYLPTAPQSTAQQSTAQQSTALQSTAPQSTAQPALYPQSSLQQTAFYQPSGQQSAYYQPTEYLPSDLQSSAQTPAYYQPSDYQTTAYQGSVPVYATTSVDGVSSLPPFQGH